MEYPVEPLKSSLYPNAVIDTFEVLKEAEACISVERTVKVLKDDATRACNSVRPEIGLPSLTMDDVREIWETLKSEGKVFDNKERLCNFCCQF